MSQLSSERRWTQSLLYGVLLLLPTLYLLLVLRLQPSDRLGTWTIPPSLQTVIPAESADGQTSSRWLWDDYDTAAMALRGLNAHLGRTPGRPDPPQGLGPEKFAFILHRPAQLEKRYFLEWPHVALWLFRFAYFLQPPVDRSSVPAAVLDSAYHDLVRYQPQTEGERLLWMRLRGAMRFYSVIMVLCLLGLIVVLRRGYEGDAPMTWALVLLVLPGALYFTVSRFDVLPALLTALSFACLGRGRLVGAAIFLGIATMVKVYPILLAPLILRYLLHQPRNAALWLTTYSATMGILLLPPLVQFDWVATWAPYAYQLGRPPEMGWTGYGFVFPEWLADQRWWRLGTLAAAVVAVSVTRPRNLESLLRRCALVLIVFVAVPVFYSPQWILWFLPLLVPLARRHAVIFNLALGLDLITYLSFPIVYDMASEPGEAVLRAGLIYARYVALATLASVLIWMEWRCGPVVGECSPAARR